MKHVTQGQKSVALVKLGVLNRLCEDASGRMNKEPTALAAGPEATVDQAVRPEASACGSQENANSSAQDAPLAATKVMTDPQHLADHAWKDAEALVQRIEQAARSNISPESFFADLSTGLRLTAGASAVVVWVSDSSEQTILARSGIAIYDDESVAFDPVHTDHRPQSQWIDGPTHNGDRLRAIQWVNPEVQLGLDLCFDQPVEFWLRQPLGELAEVLIDLATTVYLRSQVDDLRTELHHRTNRDALISRLNEGVGLADSFASIASAVASETMVDRVSLLRRKAGQYRMITTSTQPKVDRRARAVRLLERLTATALDHADGLAFTVGAQVT